MKKMLFIYNPKAGKAQIRNKLADILDVFTRGGYEITIYPTQKREDAMEKTMTRDRDYDIVACSGGDGTLDEVVTGMQQSEVNVPIGYIPAGSTNDFANSLGIPKDMVEAARVAVGDKPFPCDVGYFNGDTFVYVAAFGIFTEVSYKTPQQLKNVLGHAAYILEGAKQLHDIPSFTMQVEHDGEVFQDKFIFGMVTNSISVGGFKGMTGDDVKLDDGVFEVTLIKSPRNPIELNRILASLTNVIDDTDLIYTFKTNDLHIISKDKVAWTLDGEFGGEHEDLVIKNLNKQITIMC